MPTSPWTCEVGDGHLYAAVDDGVIGGRVLLRLRLRLCEW